MPADPNRTEFLTHGIKAAIDRLGASYVLGKRPLLCTPDSSITELHHFLVDRLQASEQCVVWGVCVCVAHPG